MDDPFDPKNNTNVNISDYIEAYVSIREDCEELEEQLKDKNKSLDAAERSLREAMVSQKMERVKTDDQGTFYIRTNRKYNYLAADQHKVFEFLAEHNLSDIIQKTVNRQTFSSTMKHAIEKDDGFQVPEFVTVYDLEGIGWRKS